MSIDKIGQYGGFYNQYRMPQIQQVSVEDVKRQDMEAEQQMQQNVASPNVEYAQETINPAPRMANLEDISLSFNVNETYDYIGKDADLHNLDMMSAISDMQKDEVLQQYQYFVGPKEMAGPVVSATEDGIVIQK
ncbi:MAG: hypothetical protein E7289_00685 [Lachnospiraceae bacterium]|nr:hypothetical protein [Lachnospiraceae bacterium]